MLVKLYYWHYSADRGPHILSSRAGPALLQGMCTSIQFLVLKHPLGSGLHLYLQLLSTECGLCIWLCDGKAIHDIAEYQRYSPNRRIPNQSIFARVYQTSRATSELTNVRVTAEGEIDEDVSGK